MDYFAEIKAFYDLTLTDRLSTGQIALWHALMHISNKNGWAQQITVPNRTLESLTGLSRNGIAQSRNRLKQLGLIDYKSNGTKATQYTILPLTMQDNVQSSRHNNVQTYVQDRVQNSVQTYVQNSGTLINIDETTQKQRKKDTKVSNKRFTPPTVKEVQAYCDEHGYAIDAGRFCDYYAAKGWTVGKSPMKDWKAAVRTWAKNAQSWDPARTPSPALPSYENDDGGIIADLGW